MKQSIQYKILLPFLLVLFIGMVSLIFVLYNINEQNAYLTIKNDMISARRNQELFLRQYFLINNLEISHLSLINESDSISKSLSARLGSDVRVYPNISSDTIDLPKDEGFSLALEGDTAYTVFFDRGRVTATISFPIQIEGKIIGIMTYSKDYTDLFNNNSRFLLITGLFAAAIFLAMLITSYLISGHLVKPIKSLIRNTDQISKGKYDLDIDIDSRDEIGELANKFEDMAKTVKRQIEIIEKDRDEIRETQEQTKSFFDNVTHELKTPLTTILGYAQVIKENGFTDREFFDRGTSYIINEGQRLNDLVMDILNASRTSSNLGEYDFQELDLTELLRQTCDEMRIDAGQYDIQIDDEIQDNLLIRGDRDRLKEVITNLLDNSIKYGYTNSTIRVVAFSKGPLTFITIKDRGIGIPEKDLDRIFEPFYRVSGNAPKRGGSTGLGLSIVKNIIEIHGGAIDIKSQVNQGTEVNISLGGD